MKYFITGGAGFIGTNLIKRLVQSRNNEIFIFDNFSNMPFDVYRDFLSVALPGVIERCEIIEGDILNYDHLRLALPTESSVIHLAANTGVQKSLDDPIGDAQTNVIGSLNLLRAATEKSASLVIGASSAAPVGIGSEPPFSEDSFPMPISPYGVSKLSMEHYFRVWSESYGLRACALRFTNVYGSYSHLKTSVVASMIRSALSEKKISIFGDGTQVRDFLHADDLVEIIIAITDFKVKQSQSLYQLGTGYPTQIIELARMVKKSVENITQLSISLEFQPPKQGDVQTNYADPTQFHSVSGILPEPINQKRVDEITSQLVDVIDASL